ncbi:MAG: hypothetical protein WBN29_12030 [Polyangiales bacterium]
MFRQFSIIAGLALAVLLGSGTPSTARAERETDESPSEGGGQVPDALSWQLLVTSYYMFNAHRVAGPTNGVSRSRSDGAKTSIA